MTVKDETTQELLNNRDYYLERLEAGVRTLFEREVIERKLAEIESHLTTLVVMRGGAAR